MAKGRWKYLSGPDYTKKSESCPECVEPSRVYLLGSKTVDGIFQQRFECENHHIWILKEQTKTP